MLKKIYPPIPMTFSEFIGPYKLVDSVFAGLHANRALRWLAAPEEPLATLDGGYTIHRVLYSVHPDRNGRQMQRRGPAVIAQISGVTVGGAREHYVWVHSMHSHLKAYPNLHIAAEMGIAWFLMTRADGTDWRLTPQSRTNHGHDSLTKAGLAFRKMQYVLMVQRGILDPGDSNIPTKS